MNENKLLVEVTAMYGKGDGEKVNDRFVINDGLEKRQELVDQYGGESITEYDEKDFINGKYNSLDKIVEGEWDEPTNLRISLISYHDKELEIKSTYRDDMNELNELFEEVGGEK